ncbi:hypothetical protein, partial [Sporomusa sp. GT1]|uniref:hypothetical protein n=1 Tax=Sporomusa sp. GT1 TaxID=1534747 RepID=UPI0016666D83
MIGKNMEHEFIEEELSSNPGSIVNCIANYKMKNVDSTIFSAIVQYEHWLGIYRSKKDQYKNRLEAFTTLWTCSLIDIEEWHDHYEPTTEFAKAVYKNFFKKDSEKYEPKDCEPHEAREYIMYKVERMIQNVKSNREKYPLKSSDMIYPNSIPGIYVNRKIVNEDLLEFKLNEKHSCNEQKRVLNKKVPPVRIQGVRLL